MLKAITRSVSRNLSRCELTFRRRERVDLAAAARQHDAYLDFLGRRGAEVINLEASDEHPDCCFVADTAVVLDEVAVICRMGAPSRRGETPPVEQILSAHREIVRLPPPAALDGGDVVVAGRQIYVGRSGRTNFAGIEELARAARPYGYRVTEVAVTGSLHLTTACSTLDEEVVLLNPRWIDEAPFARHWVVRVPEDEPWAAATLSVGGAVCVEAGAPRTLELVGRHCREVESLDVSEFRKAEGSLPCLSILFRGAAGAGGRRTQNEEGTHAE